MGFCKCNVKFDYLHKFNYAGKTRMLITAFVHLFITTEEFFQNSNVFYYIFIKKHGT